MKQRFDAAKLTGASAAGSLFVRTGLYAVPRTPIRVGMAIAASKPFLEVSRSEIAAVSGVCNDEPSWDYFMEAVSEYRREANERELELLNE